MTSREQSKASRDFGVVLRDQSCSGHDRCPCSVPFEVAFQEGNSAPRAPPRPDFNYSFRNDVKGLRGTYLGTDALLVAGRPDGHLQDLSNFKPAEPLLHTADA
jgi:hypothetical protein